MQIYIFFHTWVKKCFGYIFLNKNRAAPEESALFIFDPLDYVRCALSIWPTGL